MQVQQTQESATDALLSVSVILLRESDKKPEVFVQHRVSTMDFAPGMIVFPGGRVDDVDSSGQKFSDEILGRNVRAWGQCSVAVDPLAACSNVARLLAAAIRETTEECGLILDPSTLIPWANWVTPKGLPKRFDTYFFLADVPSGAEPRHRTTEAWKSEWMRARDIVEAEAVGALRLMLPTLALLDELLEFETVSDAFHKHRHIEQVLLGLEEAQELLHLRGLRWHKTTSQRLSNEPAKNLAG